LPQDLQDMAAKFGELIQEQDAVMGQRHVARHRHVAPTDQSRIRDGVMGDPKWAGGDQRGAVAGEAGNAVDVRGLEGFGEGHGRLDGGEPPAQHRFPRARRAEQEEDVWVTTPASPSGLSYRGAWQPHKDLAILIQTSVWRATDAECRQRLYTSSPRRG
jgi:hypothetical protein